MTCCQMGAFNCPSLDCAPCPPFFVVDIYQILVNVSLSQNLTEHEYKSIAERCNIQEPTTTTTTTTTTTPSTTLMISTTTTTRTTTTTSTSAATVTSYITDTISDNITSPVDSENSTYIPKSTTVSYSTQEKTPTTSALNTSSSLSPDITAVTGGRTTPGRTDLSTGGSTSKRRWPYCNDVCLIVVITSSVCAFLIVLVALALCCRKDRLGPKPESRSNSSQRLVVNGTYVWTSSLERDQHRIWHHNPGIENLAYRKSLEVREPLKYMEYDQNWEDLDYYDARSSSLKSDKTSQRSENSPRRKRRPNKDGKPNSEDSQGHRPGMVFIPLEDRHPRSLPRIPSDTQSYDHKPEFGFPNGTGFLSLPRTTVNKNGIEHRRSKSDSQSRPSRPRSKQRPRSFEQLYRPSQNVDKRDGAVSRNKNPHLTADFTNAKNSLKTKDTNTKHIKDTKTNSSNPKGVNRSLERETRTKDNIFMNLQGSSSPKFYPPYRETSSPNFLYTTKL